MIFNKIIDSLANIIEDKTSENILIKFQEILLESGIFTIASKLVAIILLIIFLLITVFSFLSIVFNLNLFLAIIFAIAIPPGVLFGYISIQIEKRREGIEKSAPDFLRSLASMLRVGLSFENSMDELSKYGSGPLYDEIRRAVIEIRMGRDFDDTILSMSSRLYSSNLDKTFKIILEGRRSGGGLADIIDDVAEDLRVILSLKRERRASVMMAVLFLVISAAIAAPFALGMIGIYSSFMISLGKGSELIDTAILAGGSYIIIHSVLAGLIIGLIMYGDYKKGIKFSIPLTIVAYSVFYLISNFGSELLNF